MKTLKTIAMTMLMSTIAATTFTSCKDDVVEDMKSNPQQASIINSTDLQSLDNISYAVPFQVKAKGDWRIDFEFENGQQICYAYPKQGHGDTTIKICVLDNATEQHRTGEMTITDFGDNAKKTVVKLGQKSKLEGTRADNVITGNRIYGVGYGYNSVTNEVANNQIITVSEALEKKQIVTNGVNATYEIRNYKGSCFSQLANDLKAEAKFSGKYFGFRAAAGASFEAKAFQENNHDYVVNMIDVTTTRAHLEMSTQDIIANHMTDAAYDAINGLATKSTKGRPTATLYPSTGEGFKKLIKDYGTHLLVRAELGGKMKYSSTIDLSKVENEYTLNAYARCSYKNSFIKAKAGVKDDLSKKFSSNSEAIKTTLKIEGGSQVDITNLQTTDNDENMKAWLKSLENNQNTVVVNLPNAEMIPLWELVNPALKDGATRKEELRKYMEGGQMKKDFADDEKDKSNKMGKMAHVKNLDKMIPDIDEGTLIKDIYIGSSCVARVCSEFIPKFSTTERSIVIYPVSDNLAKYNMGLFIGNKAWKPQYICWKNEGAPIVTPVENSKPGMMTELYLSGSSFYAPDDDVVKEAAEEKTEVIVKDAFMQGRTMWGDGSEHPHDYPIVKIFNRIWQRTCYNQLVGNNAGNYQRSNVPFFTINNWSMAKVDDYKNLMNGLTGNNISLPVLYMSEVEGGKDLTGFSIKWRGWDVKENNQWKNIKGDSGNQMEYMTCDKNGKFGHVRLMKSGSMEIVENDWCYDDWRMELRMVQPLSPVKKTQAK